MNIVVSPNARVYLLVFASFRYLQLFQSFLCTRSNNNLLSTWPCNAPIWLSDNAFLGSGHRSCRSSSLCWVSFVLLLLNFLFDDGWRIGLQLNSLPFGAGLKFRLDWFEKFVKMSC
jgi:hypothetical protein